MMFARGVSRGMKTCASTPARAAYAASAAPALPALGTASLVAPRCFAMETATLIPRALKLCVGLSDSSLIQRSTSSANLCADSSGVPPSPNDAGSTSLATAKLRDNATTICDACAMSHAATFDSPRRDQRLQTAVYCRATEILQARGFVFQPTRAAFKTLQKH